MPCPYKVDAASYAGAFRLTTSNGACSMPRICGRVVAISFGTHRMNIKRLLGLEKMQPVEAASAEPGPVATNSSAESAEGETVQEPAAEAPSVLLAFPPGHFYSPINDPDALLPQQQRLWPGDGVCAGIDFDDESQLAHLAAIKQHMPLYDYADEFDATCEPPRFSHGNDQFGWFDSRALFGLLLHYRPKNLIEIGGGYSSLLTADVNHRLLGDSVNFISIEPYPRPFLQKGFAGLTQLITQKVEEVPHAVFDVLGEGDILFIDSSHVSKAGSDVNYLFFDILPRLRKGVLIHVHDIYLPYEYPRHWVIDENRSWNEQYVLRALLMYSTAFKVMFGSHYAFRKFPHKVAEVLNLPDGRAFGGGSLWLRKTE